MILDQGSLLGPQQTMHVLQRYPQRKRPGLCREFEPISTTYQKCLQRLVPARQFRRASKMAVSWWGERRAPFGLVWLLSTGSSQSNSMPPATGSGTSSENTLPSAHVFAVTRL
jgi:hypothetical protein